MTTIDESDWFRIPAGCVSHVAWQVGHLTIAQYRLALHFVRGILPGDEELVPGEYKDLFGRGSIPDMERSILPVPATIRTHFDRVHRRVLDDVGAMTESDLDKPLVMPHPLARNRREVLLWCGHHEMLHAGQIGMLRRLLGQAPMW